MTSLVLITLISALAGGLVGYLVAHFKWSEEREMISQQKQELRRSRLEWHRERFQDSTSRIHRPAESPDATSQASMEELEQLRLEMLLLKEDQRVERQVMQEENERLRDELRRSSGSLAVFKDLPGEDEDQGSGSKVETSDESAERYSEDSNREADHDPTHAEDESLDAWDEVILAADPVERLDSSWNESSSEEASEDSTVEESVGIDHMADVLSARDEPDSGDGDETEEHQAHDIEETDSAHSESTDMKTEDSLTPLDEIVSEEIKVETEDETEDEIKDEAEDLFLGEAEDVVAESEDKDGSSTRGFAIHWETAPEKKGREFKANEDRDSVRSWEKDAQGRSAESASKAPASASPESEQNQTPELPAFRSLHDMLQASGVSIADKTHATRQDDHALIQEIVDLDEEAFQLLQELGYASLRHLARLSDTEIYRLAAIFRIPEDRIRQEWKPTATAHLNMRASESIRK